MKFTSSARACSAARMRSPSFSRSSSSMMTTMRPARMSVRMSSMVSSFMASLPLPAAGRVLHFMHPRALDVSRHEIDFEVHPRAHAVVLQHSHGERMRDDVDAKPGALHFVDGETHTVDGD